MKIKSLLIFLLIILLIVTIIRIIKEKMKEYKKKSEDPKLEEIKNILKPFLEKKDWDGLLVELNNENILDRVKFHRGDKSFTINKEKVYLCLYDENDKYYSTNWLIFVTLHELSHVICDEIGHTEKFQKIFDELLEEAIKDGIYNPEDPINANYCMFKK
jgi:hypothetical protein